MTFQIRLHPVIYIGFVRQLSFYYFLTSVTITVNLATPLSCASLAPYSSWTTLSFQWLAWRRPIVGSIWFMQPLWRSTQPLGDDNEQLPENGNNKPLSNANCLPIKLNLMHLDGLTGLICRSKQTERDIQTQTDMRTWTMHTPTHCS